MLLSGSLNVGALQIPVGLCATFRPGDVDFRTLHRECGTPITQKRWCAFHDRAVEPEELVKGWEFAKGQFVVVEDDELAALARDTGALAIDVPGFVDALAIDPLLVDRAYYLSPADHQVGQRAYALLARVLDETGMVALAHFVAWRAERVGVLRPRSKTVLVLQTLRAVSDLVYPGEIEDAIALVELDAEERELALELVDRMTMPTARLGAQLEPEQRARTQEFLEAKLAGRETVTAPAEQPKPLVPPANLADALRQSIRKAPRRRRAKAAR
jgi:DNA end-binding protein Ku